MRIVRKGVESSERLGRQRRKIERTHSWVAGYADSPRHEHRADPHLAFLTLATALVCHIIAVPELVEHLCGAM